MSTAVVGWRGVVSVTTLSAVTQPNAKRSGTSARELIIRFIVVRWISATLRRQITDGRKKVLKRLRYRKRTSSLCIRGRAALDGCPPGISFRQIPRGITRGVLTVAVQPVCRY